MNFDFSDEQKELAATVRRFLVQHCPPAVQREPYEHPGARSPSLWRGLAELGLLGAAIPAAHGGTGAGHLELCVIAEEMGRALAPVPFVSSVALATEAILLAGSERQKTEWLPGLADGSRIGSLVVEGAAGASLTHDHERGRVHGTTGPVLDASEADLLVVAVPGRLLCVDLHQDGVTRTALDSIDPSRPLARVRFDGALAEPLENATDSEATRAAIVDRAAVLVAFEQLGGAERALESARTYALERVAFGRAIGSFQAIKHKLADMFVAVTLARSNCYFGAWALESSPAQLPLAAATARVSATYAFETCSAESLQIHGGIGFTWEADCHRLYRRSRYLSLALGALPQWEARLLRRLDEAARVAEAA